MKTSIGKYIVLALVLVVGNTVISLLLAYFAGITFDSLAFTQKMITWRETGHYPFPHWLLYLIPRLGIWPVAAEIAYELLQMLVWVCNGYILRRYFSGMKPVRWIWVPAFVHLVLWDPVQIILGTGILFLIVKSTKYQAG